MSGDIETFKKLYRDRQYVELRPLLEQAVRKSPGDAEVLSWAARCALAVRNPEEAESYAARALEADASRRDASQHLARAQLTLQKWDAALATASSVLADEPGNPGFRAIAGRASHGKGDYAAALGHFRKLLATQPNDLPALKLAGDSALRSGDFDFAIRVYSVLSESDANAALSAVQALRENRQTEAAASVLESVLQRHPGDEKAKSRAHALVRELVLRANMAEQSGSELEAVKFHAIALRLEPGSRPSQRVLQNFLRETRRHARDARKEGDFPRALSALEDLRSLTPDDPQLLFDIAQIKHKAADPGGAEAWLAAAKTGPHEDARLLIMAERLNGHGHVTEAAVLIRALSAAAAGQENGQRIRNKLIVGLQHALTRAARGAQTEDLQKLVSGLEGIDPGNAALARFKSKAIQLRSRELREARLSGDAGAVEHHALALLQLDPGNTPAMRYLTNSYTRRGKWRDALPVARELAKRMGGDAQTLRSLARICYAAREREEGLAVCDQCLAAIPGDTQLLSLREKLAALPPAATAA